MEKTPEQTVLKATLIALILPSANAVFIRNLRSCLWQATGDISFLSLFPMIPLRWISPETKIPKSFHIPMPSFFMNIQKTPLVLGDSLYLPINQIALNPMQNALRQFFTESETIQMQESQDVPFPDGGLGVYLGKSSEIAHTTIEQFPMVDETMRIRSVQLGVIEVESNDSWDTNSRYRLLHVRNLAPNNIVK